VSTLRPILKLSIIGNDPPSIANLATPSQGANADDDDGMFGPNSTYVYQNLPKITMFSTR